jgi:hypothetical protein
MLSEKTNSVSYSSLKCQLPVDSPRNRPVVTFYEDDISIFSSNLHPSPLPTPKAAAVGELSTSYLQEGDSDPAVRRDEEESESWHCSHRRQ